jgi:hypothetical protein
MRNKVTLQLEHVKAEVTNFREFHDVKDVFNENKRLMNDEEITE